MLFKSNRPNRHNRRTVQSAVESTVKSSILEPLEGRVLMSANAWKAAVSGSWDDKTKWSLGHVPTSTEDAAITVAGTYTVTHSSTATDSAHSVTESAGTLLLTAGTLSSPTVKITGGALTFKGGTLSGGTLSTSGTGKVTTTSTAGIIANETLASSITMASGSVLDIHHTVTFSNNAILTVPSATLNLQDMSSGGVALAGTGKIALSGTALVTTNKISHVATIGSNVTIHGSGTVSFTGGNNNGSIAADISGKTLAVTGTLTNKGTVRASAGATLNIKNPSTFTNTGTLGANTGTILVSGAFKLAGTLNVGIGGTTAGSTYGVLNVQGALTLGGTLNVTLVNSYSPANGVAFTPIKYTSKTGSFGTSNLISGPVTFAPTYSTTALTLTAKLPQVAVTISAVRSAASLVTSNGTYDVIDFKLTGLSGVDAKTGPEGQPAGILLLDGTWTANGSVGTPMLAVPGENDSTNGDKGQWGNYISGTGNGLEPTGYRASYVGLDNALDPSRSGTGTATYPSGSDPTETKPTAINGQSKQFASTWYQTSPFTPSANRIFAEILVTPGDSVTFNGVYTTYGSNSAPITFSYTA